MGMMGSWRYIPAAADQTEVSWRPKCPLCGHKSRPTSQIVKSSHKFHIRNFPLSRNKSTGFLSGSKHQRLGRAADVSQLWSSSSLVALRLNRSKVTEDSGNASIFMTKPITVPPLQHQVRTIFMRILRDPNPALAQHQIHYISA